MASGAASVDEYGPRVGLLPPQPSATRGVAAIISASPCGQFLIYTNGTSAIVRSVDNPELAFAYTEHGANVVKVAKFAPTGKYVASGDAAGKVRVWAFTHVAHLLKYELPGIGGEVEDLVWDSEAKRILAVGTGTAKAKFFAWDTGSQLGEIVPHNKKVLTADFKPSRPFKAVMGSEDFGVSLYQGPPFKYEKGLKHHTNFVNCVRYAPDGSRFITVSSDKTGVVCDGTTGEVVGRLDAASAHAGSIFHVAWSPDGTRLVTAGGDKALKVWDMTAAGDKFPCIATCTVGKAVEDMQQSVAWVRPDLIISLSLDGTLHYWNPAAMDAPLRSVTGHQDTMLTLDVDTATGRIYSGDASGRVVMWTPTNDARTAFTAVTAKGEVPTKRAAAVVVCAGELLAASWDNTLRIGDAATAELKRTVPLPGQPKGIAVSAAAPGVRVVATGSALVVVAGDAAPGAPVAADWSPTCISMSADGTLVAVGGKDKKVHTYRVEGTSLTPDGETKEAAGEISAVAISPDGKYIAAGDAVKEVRLYSTGAGKETLMSGKWVFHTTRVTGLKWSPDSRHVATVGTDRRLCVWSPTSDSPVLVQDLANPQPFADVAWADNSSVWTLGTDGVASFRTLTL